MPVIELPLIILFQLLGNQQTFRIKISCIPDFHFRFCKKIQQQKRTQPRLSVHTQKRTAFLPLSTKHGIYRRVFHNQHSVLGTADGFPAGNDRKRNLHRLSFFEKAIHSFMKTAILFFGLDSRCQRIIGNIIFQDSRFPEMFLLFDKRKDMVSGRPSFIFRNPFRLLQVPPDQLLEVSSALRALIKRVGIPRDLRRKHRQILSIRRQPIQNPNPRKKHLPGFLRILTRLRTLHFFQPLRSQCTRKSLLFRPVNHLLALFFFLLLPFFPALHRLLKIKF